jgi:hypothetical protein
MPEIAPHTAVPQPPGAWLGAVDYAELRSTGAKVGDLRVPAAPLLGWLS